MSYGEDRRWRTRELTELRVREAQYRERLAHRIQLGKRLQTQLQRAHALLRADPPSRPRLSQTLIELALISSRALEVKRAGVWIYEPARGVLRCSVLVVEGVAQVTEGQELDADSCPNYLKWLREHPLLAVEDARNDPRTSELSSYLDRCDVGALLDISVSPGGSLVGVICHEHVGAARAWDSEEVAFAWHLGSLMGLTLETERRVRAEYAAKGAEAKYRHLVESLPVTVYSLKPESLELKYVSPQVSSFGDWTPEAWLSAGAQAWKERICEPEREAVVQRLRTGLGSGYPEELVYKVCLPDREIRWVRDTCKVVRDERGEPLAIQGVLSDITDQKEAELESAEHLRRARSFMDHAQLLAAKLDMSGRVTDVNPYFLELAKCPPERVIGTDWYARVTPEDVRDELRASFQEAMRTGNIEPRAEYSVRLESGEVRTAMWTRTVLLDTHGRPEGLATLGVDITEHLRLEAELLAQTKNESLGRLAAGLAHDFNNLLAVVSGQAELLSRHAQARDAKHAKRALDIALKQAAELTQSMLVYGKQKPDRKQRTDVDALIREVTPLMMALAGDGIRLATSLHADGASVWMDPLHLRQVLLNLSGNAADAVKEGGSSIQVRTHLELVQAERARARGAISGGQFVVLTLSDDGPGITPQTRAHIFDPFFTTKSAGQGTGLGLPVCQAVVQRAGGFIEVESERGQGATFRVFLPVMSAPRQAPMRESSRGRAGEERVTAGKGSLHVLLVWSDPAASELAAALREAGYLVHMAHSARSATQQIACRRLDVLLVESEDDALAARILARSARAVHPHLRAVLLVSADDGAGEDAFDATLVRPFGVDELLRALEPAPST